MKNITTKEVDFTKGIGKKTKTKKLSSKSKKLKSVLNEKGKFKKLCDHSTY